LTTEGKRVLILGAGFGGLTAATILRRQLPPEHQIIVIDKSDYFLMGTVNLWILAGHRKLDDSKVPLTNLKNKGINFLHDFITHIDFHKKSVKTKLHENIEYDYLIIALGVDFALERIRGFTENGGFNLYDANQIPKLRERILSLKKGRIAVCIADTPYKCPPAPYEASLIIDDILTNNGTRNSINIDVYTPTPIALPVAGRKISQDIVSLLDAHKINLHLVHKLKMVLNENEAEFRNGDKMRYDILIGIPPHVVPIKPEDSPGLLKEGENWITVNSFTLRTTYENVFAVGDVTEIKISENLAIPKAGIFAEAEAKAVSQQIIDDIRGNNIDSQNSRFDGKGYCFLEIGNNKAGYLAADFYNMSGPITMLEPPNEASYQKKIEFERSRTAEWLL
jgi:sulfide:quinone oxidoreductase